MEVKVVNTDVISTLVIIGIDVCITKDGIDHDLELNVRYDSMPNMGTTEIEWDIVDGDDEFLDDDLRNELDDFIQDYVSQNIGRM